MFRVTLRTLATPAVKPAKRRKILERKLSVESAGSGISQAARHLRTEEVRLPWGSFAVPDFGEVRRSTDLSKPQMDKLIREYLPEERVELLKQRKKDAKKIVSLMKTNKQGELRNMLEHLRSGSLSLDEVGFVTLIFAYLQLPKGRQDAEQVTGLMMRAESIHPSLKELLSGFVSSLKTLEQFDAYPDRVSIVKAYVPFSEIANRVRNMRLLGFRVAMNDRIKRGEIMLDSSDPEDDPSVD